MSLPVSFSNAVPAALKSQLPYWKRVPGGCAPRRPCVQLRVARRMIDAGARHQQVQQRGVFLHRQERLHVVQSDLLHGLVDVDRPVGDVLAEEHPEHALADRCDLADVRQVAVLEQDLAVDDDHQRRRPVGLEPGAERVEARAVVARGLGLVDPRPLRFGKDRRRVGLRCATGRRAGWGAGWRGAGQHAGDQERQQQHHVERSWRRRR